VEFLLNFLTDETINTDSVVRISYNGTSKPFDSVEIIDGKLYGIALECGYWARKL